MARIPFPQNTGNMIAEAPPRVRVPEAAFVQDLSGVKSALGNVQRVALNEIEREKSEQVALNRAEASNSLLDRQLTVQQEAQATVDGLADGTITYRDAQEQFRKKVTAMPLPHNEKYDPVTQTNLQRGVKRVDASADVTVARAVQQAKVKEFGAQTEGAMDTLGKLSNMPGADVNAITQQLDSLDALGSVAYGQGWAKRKQDAKDRMWFNEGNNRLNGARESLEGTRALEAEFAGDNYAKRLDPDRRNALVRQAQTQRIQIENRVQHNLDKVEKRAERGITEMDKQISEGIPFTATQITSWGAITKGTPYEGEFQERLQSEVKVQELLRQPLDVQRSTVDTLRGKLLNEGGTLRDKANLDRLARAVEANTKQLQDTPLLFAQARTGQEVTPIDVAALFAGGDGAGSLRDNLRERAATVGALQKQHGQQVRNHILLPQEATQLTQALEKATPAQAGTMFTTLYQLLGDSQTYNAAMQQIAPDSPVKAYAGVLMARQREITLQSNLWSSDIKATSGNVGELMISGESLLNKSKGQKGEDGASRNFPLPPEKDFRTAFVDQAGSVFAGRAGQADIAMQAVRSYYTGKAAADGDVSGVVDNKRMTQAITAVLGSVVNFNSGGQVFAPWGMDASDFKDRARVALDFELKRAGFPDAVVRNAGTLGLENYSDRSGNDALYVVKQGRNYLKDAKGNPIVVDLVNRPNAQTATGKIK